MPSASDMKSALHRGWFPVAACILVFASLLSCVPDEGGLEVAEVRRSDEPGFATLEETVALLEEENANLKERIAELERKLEAVLEGMDSFSFEQEARSYDKERKAGQQWESPAERTVRLVDSESVRIHLLDHAERLETAVLLIPRDAGEGRIPLIVTLHGFGGDSADFAEYVPLHEHVSSRGFALLLPSGQVNDQGLRFWNPTDHCCDGGKSGGDDIGYLTDLVESARRIRDFGAVHFFGYSNGGFMAYHMACKGLPGLRAVVSLAGTSYVEDSACEGSHPVSVLHIHGTSDSVIRYAGTSKSSDAGGKDAAFYAGAEEMVTRWSQRAGCEWPGDVTPVMALDLDLSVSGPETLALKAEPGCASGIDIELWMANGSGHGPDFQTGFADALLEWLLSQS